MKNKFMLIFISFMIIISIVLHKYNRQINDSLYETSKTVFSRMCKSKMWQTVFDADEDSALEVFSRDRDETFV